MTAANLATFRTAVQNQMEVFFPATITLASTGYACATTGRRRSRALRPDLGGGFLDAYEISFRVSKTLLAIEPTPGATLTWNGGTYRIERVHNAAADVAWKLDCDDISK